MIRFLKNLSLVFLLITTQAFGQSATEYELGGGDSLRISVFLSPELTTEVRISEAGTVSLPMIGQLNVAGLSVNQVENLIATKLKQGNFIQNAQVTASISAFRAHQVSILGNVARPGRYPLEVKGLKLTDLLATAGGVTASGGDIMILTRVNERGEVTKTEIDLASIFLKNEQTQNISLKGGDSIYVDKQPQFFIYGQIGRPGVYPLDRGLTVSQAIAKGGSYTLRSRESGVRLLRRDNSGKMHELTPKMDDLIKADDQLFVRESLF